MRLDATGSYVYGCSHIIHAIFCVRIVLFIAAHKDEIINNNLTCFVNLSFKC